MNFDAALIIYITQDVVARNGVATRGEDVAFYRCFGDDAGQFLVEVLSHNKQVLLVFLRFVAAFLAAHERHALQPAKANVAFLLTQNFV